MTSRLPDSLAFVPFDLIFRVDGERRYPLELDPHFPLAIHAFEFPLIETGVPLSWHERLELLPRRRRGRVPHRRIDRALQGG
jgi:hypothetical protein